MKYIREIIKPKYKIGEWITSFMIIDNWQEKYKVVGIKIKAWKPLDDKPEKIETYFYNLQCPKCKEKFEVNDTHCFMPRCKCFPENLIDKYTKEGYLIKHSFQGW